MDEGNNLTVVDNDLKSPESSSCNSQLTEIDIKPDTNTLVKINSEVQETIVEQCENVSNTATSDNCVTPTIQMDSPIKSPEQLNNITSPEQLNNITSPFVVKIKEEPFNLVDYDTDGTTDEENDDGINNEQEKTPIATTIPSVVQNTIITTDNSNASLSGLTEPEKTVPPQSDITVLPLPAFIHDYGRKESSDSSDSESDSSSDSTETISSDDSSGSSDNNCVIIEKPKKSDNKPQKKQNNWNSNRTQGELALEDLPQIEDLYITVPEKDITHIGKVSSIVQTQVIVQTFENQRALDLDTVLFLKDGTPLGQVFDVFGRVAAPFYSVRFNSEDDIKNKGIEVGCDVFCAPTHEEVTKFVFTEKLMIQKGSDASWKDNNEPPEELLEFSDDEQEKMHKMKLKAKRKGIDIDENDIQIVHSNVASAKNRNPRNQRGSRNRPLVRPNRFNAPTPDLNSTNGQTSQSSIQQWDNFYQPDNNLPNQPSSSGFEQQQNQFRQGQQYPPPNTYQTGPPLLSNPYVFGAPPSMFNNPYPNQYNYSGGPRLDSFNGQNYPGPSREDQFQNPAFWNNQPLQSPWYPFGLAPQNSFNQPGPIDPPQRAAASQIFNMCFTRPPPPPPPPFTRPPPPPPLFTRPPPPPPP